MSYFIFSSVAFNPVINLFLFYSITHIPYLFHALATGSATFELQLLQSEG